MKPSSRRTLLALAIVGLALAGGAGGFVFLSSRDAALAYVGYQQQRSQLNADLQLATRQGFTPDDLQPVTSQASSLDRASSPLWFGDRATFYQRQEARATQLDANLRSLEAQLTEQAHGQAAAQVEQARSAMAEARQAGAVDTDVDPLQRRLDELASAEGSARTVADDRSLIEQGQALDLDIARVRDAQRAENQTLQAAAAALRSQTGGSLAAIHQAGTAALAAADNDATIAYTMNKPSPFKGFAALSRAYERMERYAPTVNSGDVGQAALAAAAAQRYAGQIHQALNDGFPSKVIVVSHAQQQLWAYEEGQLVRTTPVTTGGPDLPTDIGPMKVLAKSSPWTMHSPWPKGSPHWYPDTVVKMVLWFTRTGEGLHDAYWEPIGDYGPGSEYKFGIQSHGCIHVPFASEQFLYSWAPVGTPVIVYWGDGSPVASQLGHITTDNHGNPLSGP
jgi:lipoprotein-anchoring transpeptidase ErfK/SrfK